MLIILLIYIINISSKGQNEEKKKSPWLELEPTKVITLEQGIISRKEVCYIEFVLVYSSSTSFFLEGEGEFMNIPIPEQMELAKLYFNCSVLL